MPRSRLPSLKLYRKNIQMSGRTHERTRFATQRMTILSVEGIRPTLEPTHKTRENILTF